MRKYEKRQAANNLRLEIKEEATKEVRRCEDHLKKIKWFRFRKRILLRIELIHFNKVLLSTARK